MPAAPGAHPKRVPDRLSCRAQKLGKSIAGSGVYSKKASGPPTADTPEAHASLSQFVWDGRSEISESLTPSLMAEVGLS